MGSPSHKNSRDDETSQVLPALPRVERALHGAPIGTWTWDIVQRRFHWDANMLALFGKSAAEVVEGSLEDFLASVDAEHRERVASAFQQASWGECAYDIEFCIVLPDATSRWMAAKASVEKDDQGQPSRLAGWCLDITDRKAAEKALLESHRLLAALREQEALMSGIVDSAIVGIVTIDCDLNILSFNPAASKMFKRPANDVLGHSIETLLPERYRGVHARQIREFAAGAVSARPTGRFGEICGLRGADNGAEFPIEASIAQVAVPGTKLYTLTLRDGTDRNRAEGARLQLESRLRQAQKMEAIGTLAGGIAHDFNNILAAIVPNVELAQESLPEEHPAREELSDVLQASLRARDLVKQILAFSQHRKAKPQVLSLCAVVDEAAKQLRASVPATVTMETRFNECRSVLADASQIHQVMSNLCANAFQAMPFGGSLVVEVSAVHLDAEAADAKADLIEGDYVRLTIKDSGQGMKPETMDRIFEPFFTTKALGQGTGLGLAVVHGIVKAHGASIEVESEVGRGSTFHVWFPVVDSSAARDGSIVPSSRGDGRPSSSSMRVAGSRHP